MVSPLPSKPAFGEVPFHPKKIGDVEDIPRHLGNFTTETIIS